MNVNSCFQFDNSYARLPGRFFASVEPTPVTSPGPIRVNHVLANQLGLHPRLLESPEGTEILAGNVVPLGAEPLAMAYAGHQFGSWVPQLGDGRAILLGEVFDRDQVRHDIQLKGPGRTPFSRGGDGRAPLGPVLREYIVSEAMAALGIPTTRALAAVTTGEMVFRDRPLPGAVLTRVAQSHIRVGTFEFFAAQGDSEAVKILADHVIERHFVELATEDQRYRALLEEVITRQASLMARWMSVGFIHGVMNTDNMLVSGETIDYGPCAFMDQFHPDTVFSSIDYRGRYAFGNQASIAQWNLARLAQALMPLLADTEEGSVAEAQQAIDAFPGLFQKVWSRDLAAKIGVSGSRDGDDELTRDLLQLMAEHRADFTLTFRLLADLAGPEPSPENAIGSHHSLPVAFDPWLKRWRTRLSSASLDPTERQAAMYRCNPALIPRNHHVERVITAAQDEQDFGPFHALVEILAQPYDYHSGLADFVSPPLPEQVVQQTFCGT